MKVLHVITGISRQAGGPSRSAQGLVAAECAAGVDAWLWPINGGEPWIAGVRCIRGIADFEQAERTPLLRCPKVRLNEFDLVHIHGIWSWQLHKVAVACRRAGVRYVIAPRGMLEPWSLQQRWLKKRVARFLYQDRDLRLAAALHATAESEAEQFRALGFKNPIIVSPNGVNVPDGDVGLGRRSRSTAELANSSVAGRRALFVSRMHPKKGVLELVESWARVMKGGKSVVSNRITENWFDVEDSEVHSSTVSRVTVYKAKGAELSNLGHAQAEDSTPFVDNKIAYFFTRVNPAWQCELVYTMSSAEERAYEQKVKDRILSLGMSYQDKDGNLHSSTSTSDFDFILTGPLDDEKKWEAYARADLFVLPTYSENFGIVVAEALWAGVPVITTKGTPWAELESEKCGWWIDLPKSKSGVEVEQWNALDSALREAMACGELEGMGARGRKLVEKRYTWGAVCDKMIFGYKEVLNGWEPKIQLVEGMSKIMA